MRSRLIILDHVMVLIGPPKTLILQGHLHSHGANMITDIANVPLFQKEAPDNFYYLVPHTMARYDIPTLPATVQTPTIVNEFWVERCLFKKRFDSPREDTINSPFNHRSIAGWYLLHMCSSSSTKTEQVSRICPYVRHPFKALTLYMYLKLSSLWVSVP